METLGAKDTRSSTSPKGKTGLEMRGPFHVFGLPDSVTTWVSILLLPQSMGRSLGCLRRTSILELDVWDASDVTARSTQRWTLLTCRSRARGDLMSQRSLEVPFKS